MNIKKGFIFLMTFKLFNTTSSFIAKGITNINVNTPEKMKVDLLKINDQIYHQYDKMGENKKFFEPNMFSTIHSLTEKNPIYPRIVHNIEILNQNMGKETVKLISSALPNVDSIGHQILHANNIYINDILNNPKIPHELQKELILVSIKLAQYGDDMGSNLLQLYYDIVEKCL
tara:strand:+ start:5308 stop:5826 length:519 start_codon:yes stop_codon:yes gene_type:complete